MRGALGVALLLALATICTVQANNVNVKLTNTLVDLIAQGKYDAFTAELSKDGMDANQPDEKGRLPLIEAVKTKDIRFVDALIQFGALANVKDPATGAAPLQFAFTSGLVDIARLLLAYGADINVADKAGKKPRNFAPSKEISELIKQYDAEGAMAFEDAPGSWIHTTNEKGAKYWFNIHTNASRWNTPPSCAWQRITAQGKHFSYVNSVTAQTVGKLPKALSWRLVTMHKADVWFNWAVNYTVHDAPAELPAAMVEELREMKNVRWYNTKTKEWSWEDPMYHTPWRALKSTAASGDEVYYYNVVTGETVWELPDDLAWTQLPHDEAEGKMYWFNQKTGESSWEHPNGSWEKVEDEL